MDDQLGTMYGRGKLLIWLKTQLIMLLINSHYYILKKLIPNEAKSWLL
jgi:hypothetical protein